MIDSAVSLRASRTSSAPSTLLLVLPEEPPRVSAKTGEADPPVTRFAKPTALSAKLKVV